MLQERVSWPRRRHEPSDPRFRVRTTARRSLGTSSSRSAVASTSILGLRTRQMALIMLSALRSSRCQLSCHPEISLTLSKRCNRHFAGQRRGTTLTTTLCGTLRSTLQRDVSKAAPDIVTSLEGLAATLGHSVRHRHLLNRSSSQQAGSVLSHARDVCGRVVTASGSSLLRLARKRLERRHPWVFACICHTHYSHSKATRWSVRRCQARSYATIASTRGASRGRGRGEKGRGTRRYAHA